MVSGLDNLLLLFPSRSTTGGVISIKHRVNGEAGNPCCLDDWPALLEEKLSGSLRSIKPRASSSQNTGSE